MSRSIKSTLFASSAAAAAILSAALVSPAPAFATETMTTLYDGAFTRVPAERESGRSVAAHCQVGGVTSADHWADAPGTVATNGFTTDAEGHGSVTLTLDYPVVGGAFPFQRYTSFDAENLAFTHDTPRAIPVAIADAETGVPFTLRLASHCGDNLHNGLIAGQHEPWFDWLAD